MRKYFLLFMLISIKNLKSFLIDRENFFIYSITLIFYNALNIIFLKVVFTFIPSINGWTFFEILFINGYFTIVIGFFYILFSWCMWFSNSYIIGGKLDSIRINPVNSLYFIIVSEMGNSIMEINSVILGLIIIFFSITRIDISINLFMLIKFVISIIGSVFILSSYFIFFSAISFRIKSTTFMGSPFIEIFQFSQYPVDIYSKWFKFVLIYVFPISFIGFFPSASIIKVTKYNYYYLITILIGLIMFYLSIKYWLYNLQKYESVGN